LFWVVLSRIWAAWRRALYMVARSSVGNGRASEPAEARTSRRKSGRRSPASSEIRALIQRMAAANPFRLAAFLELESRYLSCMTAWRALLMTARSDDSTAMWSQCHQNTARRSFARRISGLRSLPIPLISLILPATRGSEEYAMLP